MNPVTTHPRARRADAGRRAVVRRRSALPATLFDAAPTEPVTPLRAGDAVASGETLDRIVVGGWEQLTSRTTATCLLCGGAMQPVYGAHSTPIGGRCRDCGTTLS